MKYLILYNKKKIKILHKSQLITFVYLMSKNVDNFTETFPKIDWLLTDKKGLCVFQKLRKE